jgi:uncharacterized protein
MLIRFFVTNFMSFNQKLEYNMLAGPYKRHSGHVYDHGDTRILKNSAFYGSNGAGKTNFIIALDRLKSLVTRGTRDKTETIPYDPFRLDKSQLNKPTEFEIDFLHNDKIFSYSIKFTDKLISEEWLYILNDNTNDLVFERTTEPDSLQSNLKFNKSFFSGLEQNVIDELQKRYQNELRHNQPFIFEGYNKNLKNIDEAYGWFKDKLFIIFPNRGLKGLVYGFKNDSRFHSKFEDILKKTGLDLDKIDVSETKFNDFFTKAQEEKRKEIESNLRKDRGIEFGEEDGVLYSAYLNEQNLPVIGEFKIFHKDVDGEFIQFKFSDESRGTNRILSLIPALINISEKEYVIIIDEIENSLHPRLLDCLLRYIFKSNTTTKGQLLFSTHQTNLLTLKLLRQDEIWFFNKTDKKSTNFYSLSDFRVRFDLDIRKGYLKGMFGSIPCINNYVND